MTLSDLPALRALAEAEAQAVHHAIFGRIADGERLSAWTAAYVSLLSDLSRPASRDVVVRLVAEALGVVCGAAAPEFKRMSNNEGWLFRAGWGTPEVSFVEGSRRWTAFTPLRPGEWFRSAAIDGISAAVDPAEALTMIALAVLGGGA